MASSACWFNNNCNPVVLWVKHYIHTLAAMQSTVDYDTLQLRKREQKNNNRRQKKNLSELCKTEKTTDQHQRHKSKTVCMEL